MKRLLHCIPASALAFLLVAGLLSAFALSGIDQIPFHPDESTQLYNSLDFDLFIASPKAMAWYPETAQHLRENDRRLYYRLLDAPITRYLLGFGRRLAWQAVPAQDWDWSQTWEANLRQGAVPAPGLLYTGRLVATLLLPFSLGLIYLIGRQVDGPLLGLVAMLFFGLNALTLLHTRRAMAESALVCGVAFAIWSFLRADRQPWLAGLGIAAAFNAKQSALLLLPVGLLAVIWTQNSRPRLGKKMLWNIVQYGAVFLLVTLALNPFLWRYPIQAGQAAWQVRQTLSARQELDAGKMAGEADRPPAHRVTAMLINLFIASPAFAEYGNYSQETREIELNYLANPLHRLFRGVSGGGILFGLTLMGMVLALLQVRQGAPEKRRGLILLLLSTLTLFLGLAWLIGLPWQRYLMPLVPLTAMWQGYALARLWVAGVQAKTTQKAVSIR